jgi:quercetin dioxygenase-like cupin family protein
MTDRSRIAILSVVVLAVVAASAQSPKQLVENDRVRITHVDLAHGQSLPDDNRYETVTVRLEKGETAAVEPGQLEKADTDPYGESHYFIAGTRRGVKNLDKRTLPFVEIQFLHPQGKYAAIDVPPSHYCNPGAEKECVTERYLYCTERFCAESVVLDPGAASTQHTHDSDYIVVATSDFTWREEPVGKPPAEQQFKRGDVRYIESGGSHRLVNTGTTPAKLFVIQFK